MGLMLPWDCWLSVPHSCRDGDEQCISSRRILAGFVDKRLAIRFRKGASESFIVMYINPSNDMPKTHVTCMHSLDLILHPSRSATVDIDAVLHLLLVP